MRYSFLYERKRTFRDPKKSVPCSAQHADTAIHRHTNFTRTQANTPKMDSHTYEIPNYTASKNSKNSSTGNKNNHINYSYHTIGSDIHLMTEYLV